LGDLLEQAEGTFTLEYVIGFCLPYKLVDTWIRERRERKIFQQLLQMIPGLEERLLDGSSENLAHISELVRGFKFLKVYATDFLTDTKRLFHC
jgi:hypothetical protein